MRFVIFKYSSPEALNKCLPIWKEVEKRARSYFKTDINAKSVDNVCQTYNIQKASNNYIIIITKSTVYSETLQFGVFHSTVSTITRLLIGQLISVNDKRR